MHRTFARIAAVLLSSWAVCVAVLVVRDALIGQRFGPITLRWSSRPAVWLAELALAAAIVIVATLAAWRAARPEDSRARALKWTGAGLAGVGALCVVAGCVGLAVESPGIDALARDESLYILGGAVQVLLGCGMALPGLASGGAPPEE